MTISQRPAVTTIMPGLTTSGIASGRQLVELTTTTGLLLNMTAAPRPLVILAWEEVADELDRYIARKRLAEIAENPARLIVGDQLRERLA
jgi:hypothetical protein